MVGVADEVERDVEVVRDLGAAGAIAPRDAAFPGDERDRSIDSAGVEQPLAESARELLGDGGLTGARGAVDRHDDGFHGAHSIGVAAAPQLRNGTARTAGAPGGGVVHSERLAEPATARRWKTFADVVAFALGTNVWISIVILPAAFSS